MTGECNGVGAMCQCNAGEYQGNVWEWVQSSRGRGIPGERIGVGAKCHANAWECRGMPV